MTMLSIPLRAMIRAAWQDSFNRTWRFSPVKAGLWTTLLHLGFASLVIWRLGGQPPVAEPGVAILFGGLQAALFAFITLFLRGRTKLYAGPVVQLIHLSPTPAQAAILAEVLSQLPARLWGGVLFTAALWPTLEPAARPWAVPALWLTVVLGGLLGHLTGLLAIMAWVRIAPQSLGAVWVLSMVATLGLVYYVAYLLLAAVSPAEIAGMLLRLGLLAACWAGILLAGPALAKLSPERLHLLVLGLGLAVGLLNYGEQAAALFSADGPRIALAAIAGVRAGQILWGRWQAATPLVLVAALTAGLTGLAARQPLGYGAAMAGLALVISLCALTWIIGVGAFDAPPREQGIAGEGEERAAALEQAPTRIGGVVGLMGAAALAAAGVWLTQLHPAWLALLPLPALAALAAGRTRLDQLLKGGLE